MKTFLAPRIWTAPRTAPYSRAVMRLESLKSDETVSHQELMEAETAIYEACGAPLGQTALARWVWYEFGQWVTAN